MLGLSRLEWELREQRPFKKMPMVEGDRCISDISCRKYILRQRKIEGLEGDWVNG